MLVGSAPREHFLGVVTDDSPVPVPLDSFTRRTPGDQALRKAAAKTARRALTGATALTGAMACKCNSTSCNIMHNTPISAPALIDSTYKHPSAQGEIVGAGAGAGGVNGAKAAASSVVSSRERTSRSTQRTEMRADNMNNDIYVWASGNVWEN